MNSAAERSAEGLTLRQSFARIEATERAVARIWLGLRNVELLHDEARSLGDSENRDLPLETVALGLEHLMKVILVLGTYEHRDQLLPVQRLKSWRHDLIQLDRELLELAGAVGFGSDRPAVADDLAFLADDPVKRALLEAMTSMVDSGRYDALTEFVGGKRNSRAYSHLEALEEAIQTRHPRLAELPMTEFFDDLSRHHRDEVVTTCLRWARSLARMFTLGYCGPYGQQLMPCVSIFLRLRDHELDRVPVWRS